MPRHGLSDTGWERIQPLLPEEKPPRRGRPWVSHRLIIDATLWILRTGAPWRDLPTEFGPWETVYSRFRRWSRDGTWERLLGWLQADLQDQGELDMELWCVDGTITRAARCAGGAPKKNNPENEPEDHALGRSQGGFTTKIHVKSDGAGHVIGFTLTGGQCHEATQFELLMEAGPQTNGEEVAGATVPEGWPEKVAGDKAYSSKAIRDWCRQHGIEPVIPTKSNEKKQEDFDKETYRNRNIVERTIGWLKECRRVLSRFEKYAIHYAGMITLAVIQRLLTTS